MIGRQLLYDVIAAITIDKCINHAVVRGFVCLLYAGTFDFKYVDQFIVIRLVEIANDNAPGQIVISGTAAAIDKAIDEARATGLRIAKLGTFLPVPRGARNAWMEPWSPTSTLDTCRLRVVCRRLV